MDLTRAASWHRNAAALLTAAERAGLGETEWAGVRARLLIQRATFAEIIAGSATPLPALTPTPGEISAAGPGLGDLSQSALTAAVAAASAALDQADGALREAQASPDARTPAGPFATLVPPSGPAQPTGTTPPPPARASSTPAPPLTPAPTAPSSALSAPSPPLTPSPSGPESAPSTDSTSAASEGWPALRNALVYGAYSLVVLGVQLALFLTLDEQMLPLFSPLCLVVLPVMAWLAGWITIGMVFRRLPGGLAAGRSPRLGAAICLAPNLLLCLGVGILFLAR